MLVTISTRALALGAVLLASALANRLDVARNKGFHPNLARSLNGRAATPTEKRASQSYRYRNDNTECRSSSTTKLLRLSDRNRSFFGRVFAGHPADLYD